MATSLKHHFSLVELSFICCSYSSDIKSPYGYGLIEIARIMVAALLFATDDKHTQLPVACLGGFLLAKQS